MLHVHFLDKIKIFYDIISINFCIKFGWKEIKFNNIFLYVHKIYHAQAQNHPQPKRKLLMKNLGLNCVIQDFSGEDTWGAVDGARLLVEVDDAVSPKPMLSVPATNL